MKKQAVALENEQKLFLLIDLVVELDDPGMSRTRPSKMNGRNNVKRVLVRGTDLF